MCWQCCGGWGDGKGFPCPGIAVSTVPLCIRGVLDLPLVVYGDAGVVDAICRVAGPVGNFSHGCDADDALDG